MRDLRVLELANDYTDAQIAALPPVPAASMALLVSGAYNDNLEITIEAVDVGTDTFTATAHGLVNDDKVFPALNSDAIAVRDAKTIFGHTVALNPYFIINATENTFQISLTSGGSAVDIVTNANLDLTKWHMEKVTATTSFTYTELYPTKRMLIRTFTKHACRNVNTQYAYPLLGGIDNVWSSLNSPTSAQPLSFIVRGGQDTCSLGAYLECIIDTNNAYVATVTGFRTSIRLGTNISDALVVDTRANELRGFTTSPIFVNQAMTDIRIGSNVPFLNGSRWDVYKLD
jgi:hypothetical protein